MSDIESTRIDCPNTPTLDNVIECARMAGGAAIKYFRHKDRMNVENKLNDSDIVTTADKESEAIVKNYIRTNFPSHAILSEESGETAGAGGYRWVIDPIDGTTNFFSGIPLWSVSIGVEHDGERVLAVVYMPATDELFSAAKGKGAFLNGDRIHASRQSKLSRSVISTGFPVDKGENPDNNLDNFAVIMPRVRDIRRLGSSTVDICYTAAGFLDGYWELNLHEWDVNAASLIAEEAGAVFTRFRPDRGISVVCAPPAIHEELMRLISDKPGK